MKKTSLALALLLGFGASFAQAANIQLFGTAEASIHIQKYKGQSETVSLGTGDSTPARIGIRGREDLGDGYAVRFQLETGYDSGTGETNANFIKGGLFTREASLGFVTPYGEIGAGRFGSLSSGVGSYALQYFSSPFGNGYGELGFGTTFMFLPRVNNAIAYVTPNYNGLDFRVMYSNGFVDEASDGSSKNTKYLGTGFKYVKGNFGGTIFYERMMWPDQMVTADGGSPKDMESITAAGNYLLSNGVKVYGGYQYYRNAHINYGNQAASEGFPLYPQLTSKLPDHTLVPEEGQEAHAFMVSVAIPALGGRICPGFSYVFGKDKAREGDPKYARLVGGVLYDYKLSKSTTVWASTAFSKGYDLFDSDKAMGLTTSRTYESYFNSTSYMMGIVHNF